MVMGFEISLRFDLLKGETEREGERERTRWVALLLRKLLKVH